MKKRLKRILSVFLLVSCFFALSSCGFTQTYENITVHGDVYFMGTQTVRLEGTLPEDGFAAKFKKSISASDIELSDALEGKTVEKVTYIDADTVELILSGKTDMGIGENAEGTVTVLASGLDSEGNSSCRIKVKGPSIETEKASSKSFEIRDITLYNVSSVLYLPVGEFTDKADAEHIRLADPSLGELQIYLEDGKLTLKVTNCISPEPSVIIAPEATTLGIEFSLCIGVYGVYNIYDD